MSKGCSKVQGLLKNLTPRKKRKANYQFLRIASLHCLVTPLVIAKISKMTNGALSVFAR